MSIPAAILLSYKPDVLEASCSRGTSMAAIGELFVCEDAHMEYTEHTEYMEWHLCVKENSLQKTLLTRMNTSYTSVLDKNCDIYIRCQPNQSCLIHLSISHRTQNRDTNFSKLLQDRHGAQKIQTEQRTRRALQDGSSGKRCPVRQQKCSLMQELL
jgi:hypothetical protein